eukprot:3953311-Ditylum_brightwellii.AAC.1
MAVMREDNLFVPDTLAAIGWHIIWMASIQYHGWAFAMQCFGEDRFCDVTSVRTESEDPIYLAKDDAI